MNSFELIAKATEEKFMKIAQKLFTGVITHNP